MAIIPKNTFRGVTQVDKPNPVFLRSTANADQFGAQEAAALDLAGRLRAQTGTAEAAAAKKLGDSVSSIGQKMVEVAIKEKKEDDTNAAKRGLIELKEGITAITIGDETNPGLFSFSGLEATNRVRGAVTDIDKLATKIAENMPSKASKTMLQIAASLHLNSVTQEIGKFRINQRNKVTLDTAEATLKSANSAAAAAPGVPQNIQDQLIVAKTESATISLLQGHSKESAAAFAVEQYSGIIESAVTSAIKQKRLDVAKDILDGKGDYKLPKGIEIDGNVRSTLQGVVNRADDAEAGQNASQKIVSMVKEDGSALSWRERFAVARGTLAGKEETSTLVELKRLQTEERQERSDSRAILGAELNKTIRNDGEIKTRLDIIQKFPGMISDYEAAGGDLAALDRLLVQKANRQEYASIDDPGFKKRISKMSNSELGALTDEEIKGNLKKVTADAVIRKRDTINRKRTGNTQSKAADRQVGALIKKFSNEARIGKPTRRGIKPPGMLSPAQEGLVQRRVDQWVSDFLDPKTGDPRIPTPSEITKEVQRTMLSINAISNPADTLLFGLFPRKGEESFEEEVLFMRKMSPQQKLVATVQMEKIPALMRADLIEAAVRNGVPRENITDGLIEALAAVKGLGENEPGMQERLKNLFDEAKRSFLESIMHDVGEGLDKLHGTTPEVK